MLFGSTLGGLRCQFTLFACVPLLRLRWHEALRLKTKPRHTGVHLSSLVYEVGLLLLQSPLLPLSFSMVLVSPVTNLLDFLFLLVILCGKFYGLVFHSHNVGVRVLGLICSSSLKLT